VKKDEIEAFKYRISDVVRSISNKQISMSMKIDFQKQLWYYIYQFIYKKAKAKISMITTRKIQKKKTFSYNRFREIKLSLTSIQLDYTRKYQTI